jgi:hypothetical protein
MAYTRMQYKYEFETAKQTLQIQIPQSESGMNCENAAFLELQHKFVMANNPYMGWTQFIQRMTVLGFKK